MAKPRKTSQRIIGMVIGVTTGILAFVFVNEMLYPKDEPDNHKNNTIDVTQLVDDMNKTTPVFINNNLRFDSVAFNTNLAYYYTLLNVNKDSADIVTFEREYKPQLINNIKTKQSMEFIRTNQLNVVYHYYDKNGLLCSSITITPDMYI